MLAKNDQIYLCSYGNAKTFVIATDREDAKRKAWNWMGGNSDAYVVSPLTNPGDKIHLALTLYV